MKTTCKTLLCTLALAGSLASCENTIELRPTDTTPLMVMNSLLNPDSVVSAELSRSKSVLDPDGGSLKVEDAEVQLYVDGTWHETLAHTGNGRYRSPGGFIPSPGQRITLTATHGTLPDIQAETPIQPAIQIEKAWFSDVRKTVEYNFDEETTPDGQTQRDTTGYGESYEFHLNLTFSDPAGERNYYRLLMKQKEFFGNSENSWVFNNIYYDLKDVFAPDPMDEFMETGDRSYYYNEFDDEIFDGKTFTLRVPLQYFIYHSIDKEQPRHTTPRASSHPDELYIDLQSIPHDYYQYLRTRSMTDNSSLISDLFAEPVQIYNNITGGIGILGSYTSCIRTLPFVFE